MNDKIFVRNNDVKSRIIDGEAVVLDISTGDFHALNKAATLIWEKIDGPNCVQDIVKVLSDKYDVTDEDAKSDVNDMINKFLEKGLIKERGDKNEREI